MLDIKLIDSVVGVAKSAGHAIMDIYDKSDYDLKIKKDSSPLTVADITSNKIITEALKKINPKIPILSEEGSDIPFNIRSRWETFWLIDPLDGTKEFIKRNGEFTVNIALIHKNKPIFGVIYAPAIEELYWGSNIFGSYKVDNFSSVQKMNVSKKQPKKLRIVTSRSHNSRELDNLLERLESVDIVCKGSSLKFCLVANGDADLYPRLGPTSEWDTAAGDAIVRYAGGSICDISSKELIYNSKDSILNPKFLVSSSEELKDDIIKIINLSN